MCWVRAPSHVLLLGGSAWAADEAAAEERAGSKAEAASAEPRLGELAGGHHDVAEPRFAAARCPQLRELLPRVPLAQVRAVFAACGTDLKIPARCSSQKLILSPATSPASYISRRMPAADAENWFGKAPPDLSLMAARARHGLHLPVLARPSTSIRPSRPARTTCSCRHGHAATCSPSLEGLKKAVYKSVHAGRTARDHRAGIRPFRADRTGQHDRGGVRRLRP